MNIQTLLEKADTVIKDEKLKEMLMPKCFFSIYANTSQSVVASLLFFYVLNPSSYQPYVDANCNHGSRQKHKNALTDITLCHKIHPDDHTENHQCKISNYKQAQKQFT